MSLIESIRRWIDGEQTDDILEEVDEQAQPRRASEEFLVKIARELAGSVQLQTKSFAIELRVDGTLNKNEFRVQPVWDETEAGHTMVTVRPATSAGTTTEAPPASSEVEPTTVGADTEGADITVVRPRVVELYSIELWREGVRQSVVPITKPEITIGRGSKSVSVDLPLKGDPEISRVHATLTLDDQGRYWLTAKGRNPTLVSGREVPREQRSVVEPDENGRA